MRWGGTRKGAGTFYTRPQLVVPIVQRTLAPLCFEPAVAGQAPRPRKPEQILALKVCDPAMGSGSFLVAALRYLTSALLQSLYAHERLSQHGERWHIRLADGLPLDDVTQESLPVPKDDSNLDDLLRARLKRHVVERCLYGVDLDALAVELARTALWVETMDYQLPFGFLDHKLKCGNSLVGAWLDRFEDYPVHAWDREGGDAKHPNFVHHFRTINGRRKGDPWSAALKQHREQVILPLLSSKVSQVAAVAGQPRPGFVSQGQGVRALKGQASAAMQELHDIIPIFDAERRAEVYATKVLGNPAVGSLRRALDTWCALWFWPSDELAIAPTPRDLFNPGSKAIAEIEGLASALRFFHWELEFPDVMTGPESGFSAILGNPPWETLQPASMEYFSNIDPLYRTYTKQQALKRQKDYFRDSSGVEENWIGYNASFNAVANWTKNVASPVRADAVPSNDTSASDVMPARQGARENFSDPAHPYLYQGGGKPYTYRMFLEVAHALLRKGGYLGFLVPSGLYSDNGSEPLRALFLDNCEWTHLYAFQNERFVFEGIHHSFKIAAIHLRKGERTTTLRTRFRLGPGDSPEAIELEDDISDDARFLPLPIDRITRFSPTTRSLLEIRSARDLRILDKLFTNGVSLGDQGPEGWGLTYRQGDFNMTSDSALFPPRPDWEAKGYKADEYGHWLKGMWRKRDGSRRRASHRWQQVRSADGTEVMDVADILDVALPLYQGIMVRAFDVVAKGWVSGTGGTAEWEEFPAGLQKIAPQYLLGQDAFLDSEKGAPTWRIAYRCIARATDARTWIGAPLSSPAGHSLTLLSPRDGTPRQCAALAAIGNSFVYDWQLRDRLAGTNVNWFVLKDTAVPKEATLSASIAALAVRLSFHLPAFAGTWTPSKLSWRRLKAVTPHERLRLRAIIDASIAATYGLDEDDFRWIMRACDHPADRVCNASFARSLDPKGFWRVDKDRPPELRHSVLSLIAFVELRKVGVERFLSLNDGDGWHLPETLRLSDYGLGHDARAKEHQPVAEALGERLLPWQLNEDVVASWEECRRHAELVERIVSSQARRVPAPLSLAPLSKAVPRTASAGPPAKAATAKRKRVKQNA